MNLVFFVSFSLDDLLDVLKSEWFDSPDNYSYQIDHQMDNSKNWSADFNDDRQMYQCDCGREYKSKGSLTDHRRWECGKVPSFQCPYCEYCAKRKKHLRRHVHGVHKLPFTLEEADQARIQFIE